MDGQEVVAGVNQGKIIGVGVGPGDPELMTLKAVRIIKEADRIVLPMEEKTKARAYQIAVRAVPELEEKRIIGLSFPMIKESGLRSKKIQQSYEKIRPYLQAGEQLAFLTIGDPCIYSTFCYLKKFAEEDGFQTALVNGVSSFTAAAARFNRSLCQEDEELHVIQGTSNLEEAIRLPGTKVVMKAGRYLDDLERVLSRYPDAEIYAVKDCGLPEEKVYWNIGEIPREYMVTVLIK